MLEKIKSFFSKNISLDSNEQIEDSENQIQIATCALLIEMASIDDEFDPVEKERIVDHFKSNFNLSDDDIKKLIGLAEGELDNHIDLWSFTNLINQNYSTIQKMKVIETIWRVIYADGKLSTHEDYLVHKLYKMLGLTHAQLIEVKMKVLKERKADD
ncbi:MAG: TerB family tellurite resistance protein [candidate division Zixibacteria bacterium]|nr:TerB family tellurite resistance protein [candidate division Zixibacteria bacterium]